MTLAAGSKLGPYEILAPIGAGGMGEVYRAKDPRLGREVAIKVLPASFSADADRLRRFEQEAKAAGVLNHPNITAVYDIGSHDGAPYVVQELLEGETLRAELAAGRFSPRKAIDYALQIAQGLAAAHEKGIVHRDLKPENLFVTKDGRVKILDFGLAKLTEVEPGARRRTSRPPRPATEPGVVMGTLGYMSPEQVKGKPADARRTSSRSAPSSTRCSRASAPSTATRPARRWRRSSRRTRRTFPSPTRTSPPASSASSATASRRTPSEGSSPRATSRSPFNPSRKAPASVVAGALAPEPPNSPRLALGHCGTSRRSDRGEPAHDRAPIRSRSPRAGRFVSKSLRRRTSGSWGPSRSRKTAAVWPSPQGSRAARRCSGFARSGIPGRKCCAEPKAPSFLSGRPTASRWGSSPAESSSESRSPVGRPRRSRPRRRTSAAHPGAQTAESSSPPLSPGP